MDPLTASALGGGINTGGGGISPSSSASSSNRGGNNSLGGFSFGNYSTSKGVSPWLIGGVVVIGLWLMFKGGKR